MTEALHDELEQLRIQIKEAETADTQVSGGLLKALIATRLEILRTTEALVQQRIHCIESGAPVVLQVSASYPNLKRALELQQEIDAKEKQLAELRTDAAQYTDGLVLSLKLSAIATLEQTIAMLQQNMLASKYGLAVPLSASGTSSPVQVPEPSRSSDTNNAPKLITVRLLNKRLVDEYLLAMDLEFIGTGIHKPSRAIKGSLNMGDLFGETKVRVGWTVDQTLKPEGSVQIRGMGFRYNQFMENHQWAHRTAVCDIAVTFEVEHILYEDGSRDDF